MSLTISAPASTARRATSALTVSMETGTSVSAVISRIRGMTRRSSSFRGTGPAPGREDSPPTSRMSAPSPISRTACRSPCRASAIIPPSEKESGVMLITPMTRVRPLSLISRRGVLSTCSRRPAWASSSRRSDETSLSPKGWRASLSANRSSCLTVPMMSTSVLLTLQSTVPRATAASPPCESISCLMMLATFGVRPSTSTLQWRILGAMEAIP